MIKLILSTNLFIVVYVFVGLLLTILMYKITKGGPKTFKGIELSVAGKGFFFLFFIISWIFWLPLAISIKICEEIGRHL